MTTEDLTRDSNTNPRDRRLGNHRLFRSAVIISAIAAQVYFLIHFLSHYSTSTIPALGEYLALIIVTVVLTAIVVMVATNTLAASPPKPGQATDLRDEHLAGAPANTGGGANDGRPNVLRIVRSCERLTSVEDELIRRVSTTTVDRPTGQLMAEMQICTRRIMKQLEELQ